MIACISRGLFTPALAPSHAPYQELTKAIACKAANTSRFLSVLFHDSSSSYVGTSSNIFDNFSLYQ